MWQFVMFYKCLLVVLSRGMIGTVLLIHRLFAYFNNNNKYRIAITINSDNNKSSKTWCYEASLIPDVTLYKALSNKVQVHSVN